MIFLFIIIIKFIIGILIENSKGYNLNVLEEAGSCRVYNHSNSNNNDNNNTQCCSPHSLINLVSELQDFDVLSSITGYQFNISKLFDGSLNASNPESVIICGAEEVLDTVNLDFLVDGKANLKVNADASVLSCDASSDNYSNCGDTGELYLSFDLHSVRSICSASIHFRPLQGPKSIKIRISLDGITWIETRGHVSNDCGDTKKSVFVYNFNRRVAARYVKIEFSSGCKSAIVLSEMQIFGSALDPVQWMTASEMSYVNGKNLNVLPPPSSCNIQSTCARRVWNEGAGDSTKVEVKFSTSCNRLHSFVLGIANDLNYSDYLDSIYNENNFIDRYYNINNSDINNRNANETVPFFFPSMDGIIYYNLNVSASKFAGGIFELSLNEHSAVSRNKLMFALIGGSHINNYENDIHPPIFTTDPLLLEHNCGCHVNILYAKILCSDNDDNPAEFSTVNLKVAWESDCDPNEPMQLIIYVLNNEMDVQPFMNYMRQSKSENKFAYNQDANGQQSIQNLEQAFVLNTITLSLQEQA